jgi:hypothetical protein
MKHVRKILPRNWNYRWLFYFFVSVFKNVNQQVTKKLSNFTRSSLLTHSLLVRGGTEAVVHSDQSTSLRRSLIGRKRQEDPPLPSLPQGAPPSRNTKLICENKSYIFMSPDCISELLTILPLHVRVVREPSVVFFLGSSAKIGRGCNWIGCISFWFVLMM